MGEYREDLIWESNDVKLLEITIDRDLKFYKHVLKLCSKANQKLSAVSRMLKLFSIKKRGTLFKAFVQSQFKYCPIVWMFHGRRTNSKINKLDERALRIVYDDEVSTFDQLLAMDKCFCIYHQNIQRILIEIYNALHDSGNSLKELFIRRTSTKNMWSEPELVIPLVNSVLKGKNSLRYFGSVIWNSLPIETRKDHSILSFVTKIKQGNQLTACPCTIRKSYVSRVS